MDSETWPRVTREEGRDFIVRCMTSVGMSSDHANVLANNLITADYRGHYSHGLNRLWMYVADVKLGKTKLSGEPVVLNDNFATAWVDGNHIIGPATGKFCMDLAIEKARKYGVGWVVAKGCNHYGIAGWYSMRAADQGLIGMSMTNTGPCTVPTRAKERVLGTNPISLAAPANNGDSFVLDMATSAVAHGKVEHAKVLNKSIPDGWGCDERGMGTNDPEVVMEKGGLRPLGGAELTSGYKGYGLAMMVETLCGITAGANYGPNVRFLFQAENSEHVNLGQCFIALNPKVFAPGFEERMTDLNSILRNLEPADGEAQVLVPGDPERLHMQKCDRLEGIPYHPNQLQNLRQLASDLKVSPLKTQS